MTVTGAECASAQSVTGMGIGSIALLGLLSSGFDFKRFMRVFFSFVGTVVTLRARAA